MIKRLTAIGVAVLLVLTLTSCTGPKQQTSSRGEVVSPKPEGGKAELTILMHAADYNTFIETECFRDYVEKFKNDLGVDVKLQKIGSYNNRSMTSDERDEYIEKLFTNLLTQDGPELIFSVSTPLRALIDQSAVVDIKDKVPNLSMIYSPLIGEQAYLAPIGMSYLTQSLNKSALQSIGIQDISLDWDSKQFLQMRDKWVSSNTVYFNSYEYSRIYDYFIDIDSFYDIDKNKLSFDKPVLEKKIKEARSYIFGGKYILNENYKYQNYYNMIFESTSQEYEDSHSLYKKNVENGHIDVGTTDSLFRAEKMDELFKDGNWIPMPKFKDKMPVLYTYGFMVNKKGKNLDLAYEFINGLLVREFQLELFYEDTIYYPVNKDIEADIKAIEAAKGLSPKAMELKEYGLQEVKSGRCKLWAIADRKWNEFNYVVYKDLARFILADQPYSSEVLSAELQKLEDKYNIWLSE